MTFGSGMGSLEMVRQQHVDQDEQGGIVRRDEKHLKVVQEQQQTRPTLNVFVHVLPDRSTYLKRIAHSPPPKKM